VAVDVRVLASTHRDLRRAVDRGEFREDLFYRLNVVPIAVPPLRDRPDDVLPLARAFAAELLGPAVAVDFAPEAVAALRAYDWPGNVRELRNFVERASLLRDGSALRIGAETAALLRPGSRPSSAPALGEKSYTELVEGFERSTLRAALDRSEGNIAGAARLLRMDRGNLHRRLKTLGLIE
jgi:transcriptional regulator with GAF, ATPase, and Fis domain